MTIAEKLNTIDSSIVNKDLVTNQVLNSRQYKKLYNQLNHELKRLYEKEKQSLYEKDPEINFTPDEKQTYLQLNCISDSMDHFFSAAGANDYEIIARIAKAFQIDHIHDIGCNLGIQGRLFSDRGIKYTGYDVDSTFEFPLLKEFNRNIECIQKEYPFAINTSIGKHMLVSRLCLGYFKKDDATAQRIMRDFDIIFLTCSDHSFIQKFNGYRVFKYAKRLKQWKETDFHNLDGASDFLLIK